MRAASHSAMRQVIQPTPPKKNSPIASATSPKTTFMPVSLALLAVRLKLGRLFIGHAFQLALDHLALDRADMVDDEAVVEVILLVLKRAREQPFTLDRKHLAVEAG